MKYDGHIVEHLDVARSHGEKTFRALARSLGQYDGFIDKLWAGDVTWSGETREFIEAELWFLTQENLALKAQPIRLGNEEGDVDRKD